VLPGAPIATLALPAKVQRTLERAGLQSVDELTRLSVQELLDIRGIGRASVEAIARALTSDGDEDDLDDR
jgi:DNA-directed RNA polymerase alpha subunit